MRVDFDISKMYKYHAMPRQNELDFIQDEFPQCQPELAALLFNNIMLFYCNDKDYRIILACNLL